MKKKVMKVKWKRNCIKSNGKKTILSQIEKKLYLVKWNRNYDNLIEKKLIKVKWKRTIL